MAGLGRKVFTAGEVLTAANVNGYLMDQTVMVFAGTAARSSALGTGVGSFMDTLTSVSLAFMTNSTLVTALVIAGLVFGVLYWVKSKFL